MCSRTRENNENKVDPIDNNKHNINQSEEALQIRTSAFAAEAR